MRKINTLLLACLLAFVLPSLLLADDDGSGGRGSWKQSGLNRKNDHDNTRGTQITRHDVHRLQRLCSATYDKSSVGGTNAAKPILVGDVIYWVGSAGEVGASRLPKFADPDVVAGECEEIWSQDLRSLDFLDEVAAFPGSTPQVRVSPAYYRDEEGRPTLFYVGISNHLALGFANLLSLPFLVLTETEIMFGFALDARTGELQWSIPLAPLDQDGLVKPEDFAISSLSSPAVHKGVAYVGFSSLNNLYSGFVPPSPLVLPPELTRLSFRGVMLAIDLPRDRNGGQPSVRWSQRAVPPPPIGWDEDTDGVWFTGGGVWTSGTSFLPRSGKQGKGLVYFGSGQLYSYPDFVTECLLEPIPPFQIPGTDRLISLRGETGIGAAECFDEASAQLGSFTFPEPETGEAPVGPLASNSIIALNAADGSFAWHHPTAGIDAFQAACGFDSDNPGFPCTIPVPGPDWDVGGSAAVLIRLRGDDDDDDEVRHLAVSHNKGGELFALDARTGELEWSADVCVGTPLGGIHFGFAYDRRSETLLVPCSGGLIQKAIDEDNGSYRHVLANGDTVCNTGVLHGIDLRTGRLKWQSVPAGRITPADDPACGTIGLNESDERFKFGLAFDTTYKNQLDPSVQVNFMPSSELTPVDGLPHAHGVPATANGVVYWPIYDGTLYALDVEDGSYLHQMHCQRGAMYGGPSVARNRVAFGCGEVFQGGAFAAETGGVAVEVFALPRGASDDDDDDDDDD